MRRNNAKPRGYTLVEVLIAAAILLLVVAAAASLSSGLTTQELLAQRTAMALNEQEQSARLWQLGVSASSITNTLLPPNPSIQSMTFTESDVIFTNLGTMRRAQLQMVFQIQDVPGSRANSLILLRP